MVGPQGRSAFLLETAGEAVKRRKLLRFLESEDAGWEDVNHPELAKGTGKWVRGLRQESDARVNRTRCLERLVCARPEMRNLRKKKDPDLNRTSGAPGD